MTKYIIFSLLFVVSCVGAKAQETDTTTIQCNCNNHVVYVRFGYKKGADTTKTFSFIKAEAKQWMIKDWAISVNGTDTFYTKTFKYIPATAIGFIANGSALQRFTNPFRFPYSDMMPDDPEADIYMTRLCTKILNAQITKP